MCVLLWLMKFDNFEDILVVGVFYCLGLMGVNSYINYVLCKNGV